MGRPKEYGARVTTAIRFSDDMHARLQKEAQRRDVGVNQLVVWAVERALQVWENQDLDALLRAQALIRGES